MNAIPGEAIEFLNREVPINLETHAVLDKGLATVVYGPYMAEMVQHAADQVRTGYLAPESAVSALGTAALLYGYADNDYLRNEGALRDDALEEHQANVLSGTIALVSDDAGTTEAQGIAQVMSADEVLRELPSSDEAALAAINYGAFFRPQTMASGTRTLDRREVNELLSTADSTQESMPHLSVSNWAIGQTVAGIYRELSRKHQTTKLRVFDMGSGHGATIAAITNSIRNVEEVDLRPELAMTAIETTPGFYEELVKFAKSDQATNELGLDVITLEQPSGYGTVSNYGTLTTVHADATEVMRTIHLPSSADELLIVTANYSWHRIDSYNKLHIVSRFKEHPNVIFIIGDLAQNTSAVNRRYFNLGVNGPINTGNRRLRQQFRTLRYPVVDLHHQKPAGLDQRIASRLVKEGESNDGHLWIAYRGKTALEVLDLQSTAA